MRSTPRLARLVPLACLAGCYSYIPVQIDQVVPSSDVRARVTLTQAEDLDPLLVRGGRLVEGQVLDNGREEILLLVPVNTDVRGARVETLHQRVLLPRSEIVELELRELDRRRTGLLVGGGAALLGGIVVYQLVSDRGGDTRPGPNGGEESRIPVFVRIPAGW